MAAATPETTTADLAGASDPPGGGRNPQPGASTESENRRPRGGAEKVRTRSRQSL